MKYVIPEELYTIQEIRELPPGTVFFDSYQDIWWEVDDNQTGIFETNPHCVDCDIEFDYDGPAISVYVTPGDDPKRPWIKKEVKVTFTEYFTRPDLCLEVKTVPYSVYKELIR